MSKTLVVDIETDGLYEDVTQIHCIAIKEKGSSSTDIYHNSNFEGAGTVDDAIQKIQQADLVVGHNWIDYDARIIKKLYPGFKINIDKIRDTYIRSRMFDPHRQKHPNCPVSKTTEEGRRSIGAHGLENWGYIVGRGKVEHEDWSRLTEDMLHRCIEDVEITDLVDNYLKKEARSHDWSQAETIEKWFRFILSEQESYGVLADKNQIDWCLEQLDTQIQQIDKEVLPLIPKTITRTDKVTKGLKADGTLTAYNLKYFDGLQNIVCGDYCKVSIQPINLQSTTQVKEYLLTQGWQPDEWNYKKDGKKIIKDKNGEPIKLSPKITESSLETIEGNVGKLIGKRITIKHRYSQIKGWKDSLRHDGRISAGGNSVGTNTARVTHRTVVNVPKAEESVFFGKEMRSIFTVADGYKMVGADLSALENRVAAHYTYPYDHGEFALRVLKEDPHQYIADQLGITRSQAKGINYGIMYGAGIAKIQSMLGCSYNEAQAQYNRWWDANPALKTLRERIKIALSRHPGWIKGLDGRKIYIRSEHSAMNALFQSAGSIINKMSTILIYKRMRAENIDGHMVINMHDEIQAEINKKDVDKYSQIVLQCYKDVGKYFNLNVPIEGETKIGDNWCETH